MEGARVKWEVGVCRERIHRVVAGTAVLPATYKGRGDDVRDGRIRGTYLPHVTSTGPFGPGSIRP